jgi:arginyl-tRNA synthetase
VNVEFVSANPTGPLHVGHGRGAAYGDSLARILRAAGYEVHTEYYINDAGRQMDILALSVWLRYLELCGETVPFPESCYQGDYIFDIAADVHRADGERHRHKIDELFDHSAGEDPEVQLDMLIAGAKDLLQTAGYQRFFTAAAQTLVDDIRNDLQQFNVEYDRWFSERSLHEDQSIARTIEKLKRTEYLYQKDGAWWFRARDFGDEIDRVVVRENGASTYFAADIAYHLNKFERGYQRLIDIWGADHHGYIERVKGAVQALGHDPEQLHIALVQFAVLYRSGVKVSMSTRSGEFVTLRELRQEVSTDAARFFYVQRKAEQHMDFDLDLAKSQSNDNPVYYVQYAHARICSVFKIAEERGIDLSRLGAADMSLLVEDHEIELAMSLNRFPEVLAGAARDLEPHQIVYYLRELANALHTYYNAHRFIDADPALRDARLALIGATRQVLRNGLTMIGVSAPQSM